MKTIYSLLYVNLNVALNEKVCIGLVMSDGETFFYQFSAKKLSFIAPLLSTEKKSFIKHYLKSLEKDIQTSKANTNKLFSHLSYAEQWAKEEYLNYLSNYANNLVSFSAPKTIALANNLDNFKALFNKYVHIYEEVSPKLDEDEQTPIGIKDQVNRQFYPQIKARVNTNITLNSADFETILVPVHIGFIGNNDIPVLGQTLDFTKSIQHVQHDITSYLSLTISVEEKEQKKGKYFVLGKEPAKGDKTHNFWQNLRTSPIVDYIELDEFEKITKYMEEHNVQPYFEKQQ
ncbi:hypothetical protein [Myroides fluvii]|uniref:hypothetical protein n=1 Tax=Myroides fluvii TaxID=2572594 RepID=UPI00131E778B|nr:hypothetical protein [Myroides fluvii]